MRRSFVMMALCAVAGVTEAGSISGIVTGPGGTPVLPGIKVTAWRKGSFVWSGSGKTTSSSGAYTFTGLTAGTYRMEFTDDSNGVYAHETYDHSPLLSAGTDLIVTAGSSTNINVSLASASVIKGKAFGPDGSTGVSGISVWAYLHDGNLGWRCMGEYANSDSTGGYTIGGLAATTYRVKFQDSENGDYVLQVYANATDLDSGTDVDLPASTTVSNINLTLAQAGKISGRVWTTNGIPLSDGWADVLMWDGSRWTYATASGGSLNNEGRYTTGGLSSGVYRVQFHTQDEKMLNEVYDNALEPEYGANITVTAGNTVSNIDAVLDTPAWPPRIVRLAPAYSWYKVAFTATNRATCVLQTTASFTNDWNDVETNTYTLKGVNTFSVYPSVYSPLDIRFWRIRGPALP
jgi:hypothetical protein